MTDEKPGPLTLIGYNEGYSGRHTFSIIKTSELPHWKNIDMCAPTNLKVLADGNQFSLINSLQAALDSYKNKQQVKKMMSPREQHKRRRRNV